MKKHRSDPLCLLNEKEITGIKHTWARVARDLACLVRYGVVWYGMVLYDGYGMDSVVWYVSWGYMEGMEGIMGGITQRMEGMDVMV